MTVNEAAVVLGIAPTTITAQIRHGKLKANRRGRQWDITPGSLEKYRRDYLGKPGRKVAK